MADAFYLGPNLRRKIQETIRRVDDTPQRRGGTRIPTRFEGDDGGGAQGKVLRICTFTGAWSIDTSRVVRFFAVPGTTNTVLVQNVLFPLPALSNSTNSPTRCLVAKDGTAWYLANVQHQADDVLTSVSLSPTALQFGRRSGVYISATASTTGISASSCEQKASGAQLSTFLG